ncbi:MAG: ligand-binding sensor domain-containing protein, partial [Chitinophagaceae bacterium]
PGLKNPAIYSMRQGPSGDGMDHSLWLSNWNGIFVFNEKNLYLRFIKNQPGNKENLLSGVILGMYQDKSGCIWLCTNGYGVSKYDPHASLFSSQIYSSPDKQTQTNNLSVLSLLDTKNYFLLGTYDGLYRINKDDKVLNKIKLLFLISYMDKSDSGKIWMAGIGGLVLYDPETGKSTIYNPGISIGGMEDSRIIKIYDNHEGGLWLLTTHSFSYFNVATKKLTNYFYRGDLLNTLYFPFHGDIYPDNKGNFWLGTEVGLLYFNTQTKTFQRYVNHPDDTSSLDFNVVECVVPDPRQPENYLWIGTSGGGLNKFNLETKKFIHFTQKEGLPNNTINGILTDDKGCLWISTNKGISKFNPADNTFHHYDIHDGLTTNEFNPGAYYKNAKGELFFGNTKGFNAFYPDSIHRSSYIPDIVFTDFSLFNQPVSIGSKNSFLKQSLSVTHLITLPHDKNMISFKVAALDYSEPYKNQYAYRLEGLNNRWINLGTDRQITLGNLTPGHYILQVKAANSDGVWNEKGISMAIHILPPWWKSWWAYLCYLILIIALISLTRKRELNRLKLKNSLALESLEASKLKEVDRMKSRFFANISHEFRTPLTLVLGPLNDFSKDHNVKGLTHFVPEMQRNAKRLLQLINQLLDLSKLDASYYSVNTSREDIIPFVKQIVHSFSSLAHRENIEIEVSVDPKLREKLNNEEIRFYFDGDIIEKILINLLSNAFKFTPAGGNIIVNLSLSEKEKDYLEMKVENTGTGIAPEKFPFIFDRFYQA